MFDVNQYALKVKQSLIDYSDTFHNSDPRYVQILNMTIHDLDRALNEIISTQIEASNFIDHIINPEIIETIDPSYLLVDYSIFYLAQ